MRTRFLVAAVFWGAVFLESVLCAEPVLLTFDTLAGIRSVRFDRDSTDKLTVVSSDTTEGTGALRVDAHSGVAEHNHYSQVSLSLASPMDLTGKAVLIDVKTPTPETCQAFYIRCYNTGAKKPAWSFVSWKKPLTDSWSTIRIQQEFATQKLQWEKHEVTGEQPNSVNRIVISIGTPLKETDFSVLLDNLRLAPAWSDADITAYRKPKLPKLPSKPVVLNLPPAPAQGLILALDTLDGVKPSGGTQTAPTRLEVTDDGGPCLRIFSHSPAEIKGNHYYSFTAHFKEPLNLKDAAIAFDAKSNNVEATPAFYVRLFNKGSGTPAWSFNSWQGLLKPQWALFQLQAGASIPSFIWESNIIKEQLATQIDRIQFIIGTNMPNADVEARIRNLRLITRKPFLNELTADKYPPRLRDTIVATNGKPAAIILHPDTPVGRKAATDVADALHAKCGALFTPRPGTLDDCVPTETAVMLGSLNSNPALRLLYARGLTLADSVVPGPGGIFIHTVHNPFGKGCNIIVLGASDDAGLALAVKTFCDKLEPLAASPSLTLPPLHAVTLTGNSVRSFRGYQSPAPADYIKKEMERGQSILDRGNHCSIAGQLADIGRRYLVGERPEDAKLFVKLWKLYLDSALPDPKKILGPWGFDSDFVSRDTAASWDILEEEPSLTNEERIFVLKTMARWMNEAVYRKASGGRVGFVTHNHGTFPALGICRFGLYLCDHFPQCLDSKKYLERADAVFRVQSLYCKPMEDCNGYQWLTLGHTLNYALMRPDYTIFTNGVSNKIADFCINCMDNFGIQVPYGDTGAWTCWNSEIDCLDMIALATANSDALWAANYKRTRKKLRPSPGVFTQLAPDMPPPTRFNGLTVWPLIPEFIATFPTKRWKPLEGAFVDKITFRQAMDPDALFLQYDGVSIGGHKHDDGNSIPRFSQFNRIWLADNDYFKSPIKYHNSLIINCDGEADTIPPYAELLGSGTTQALAVSVTRMRQYAHSDWTRAIIHLRSRNAILVLDKVTALKDAHYQLRMLWHGIGDAIADVDGLLLRQKGPSMRLQVARGPQISMIDDKELGANWRGYPHAVPVVRSMTAQANVHLNTGESYLFASLFHGRNDGDEPLWKLERLDKQDGIVLQDADGNTCAVALDSLQRTTNSGKTDTAYGLAIYADKAGTDVVPSSPHMVGDGLKALPPTGGGPAWTALPGYRPLPCRAHDKSAESAAALPEQAILWRTRPLPQRITITGNKGVVGSLKGFMKASCNPADLGPNTLIGGNNSLNNLFDGSLTAAAANAMFPKDRDVIITLNFDDEANATKAQWAAWHAKTSSKKTAFIIESVTIEASSDNFAQDIRPVFTHTETRELPDWGKPYITAAVLDGVKCKALRFTFKPRKGTSVYLAELAVTGTTKRKVNPVAYNFKCIETGRVLPEGRRAILLGSSNATELIALNMDGTTAWHRELDSIINDIKAVDLDKDGTDEIALALQDFRLLVLNADGTTRWQNTLSYYRNNPYVNVVLAGDLDGDGFPEVVCGGENWRFYAFDREGRELWNYESVHPSRSGAVVDLDGDSKCEVICGTHYYAMPVLDGTGKLLWSGKFGPICRTVATGSFNRDKTRGVIAGSANGHTYIFSSKGNMLADFNTGDEVNRVLTADLDGDGFDEAFAASTSQFLYCWKPDVSLKWAAFLKSPVLNIAAAQNAIVAGLKDGRVISINRDGKSVAERRLGAPVILLKSYDANVITVTADGYVTLLKP